MNSGYFKIVMCCFAFMLASGFVRAESGLFGKVLRPPAETEAASKVDRYRSRASSDPNSKKINCNCTPGLYSVITLHGDSLPPLRIPDERPKMSQKDAMFEPSVLAVPVGTTVEFPNLDPFFHNVFSYSKTKKFDLGRYPKGESQDVTFDTPGVVQIFCEIHYSMRAYVHVVTTPYAAVSNERGEFVIPDVKTGSYTLRVWQEKLPELTIPLTVTTDSTFVEVE